MSLASAIFFMNAILLIHPLQLYQACPFFYNPDLPAGLHALHFQYFFNIVHWFYCDGNSCPGRCSIRKEDSELLVNFFNFTFEVEFTPAKKDCGGSFDCFPESVGSGQFRYPFCPVDRSFSTTRFLLRYLPLHPCHIHMY